MTDEDLVFSLKVGTTSNLENKVATNPQGYLHQLFANMHLSASMAFITHTCFDLPQDTLSVCNCYPLSCLVADPL